MQPYRVLVGSDFGYIFHGVFPNTFVFAPESCVIVDDLEFRIDEQKYVVSGWSRKNLLLNRADTFGSRLFPQKPVFDPDFPGVAEFVERIQRLI